MKFHPSATNIISGLTFRNARRLLKKEFGYTHAQQNALISAAKKEGKIRLPSGANLIE